METTSGFDTLADLVQYRTALMARNGTLHATIGPVCLSGTMLTTALSGQLNSPIVSYMSLSYQMMLNRTDLYPTMSRVGLSNSHQALAIGCLMNHFKWRYIGIIDSPLFTVNSLLADSFVTLVNGKRICEWSGGQCCKLL